jgi:16S rRNA (uracil1498-N3)-methyltransferase
MHRFYLSPSDCKSDTLALTDREAHHAANVLRIRRSEEVTVLDGAGTELLCAVEQCDRKHLQLRVVERKTVSPLPYSITLLQAIPKGKIIESIIQKATELGVARIVPLLTERVTTRLDEDDADQKGDKWQQVAIEAIKQCGSAWLPKVEAPVTPKDFLARNEQFDLPLIGSLQPGSQHPRKFFENFRAQKGSQPKSVCIWIGPEGDFTAGEVASIIASGASPITLGRLVLRVETAATYCLSVLNYELSSQRD